MFGLDIFSKLKEKSNMTKTIETIGNTISFSEEMKEILSSIEDGKSLSCFEVVNDELVAKELRLDKSKILRTLSNMNLMVFIMTSNKLLGGDTFSYIRLPNIAHDVKAVIYDDVRKMHCVATISLSEDGSIGHWRQDPIYFKERIEAFMYFLQVAYDYYKELLTFMNYMVNNRFIHLPSVFIEIITLVVIGRKQEGDTELLDYVINMENNRLILLALEYVGNELA